MDKIAGCYQMAESLLVYGFAKLDSPQDVLKSRFMKVHSKQLGDDTVVQIAKQVADSIANITHNVYTDTDGCSYNTMKYKNGASWLIDLN